MANETSETHAARVYAVLGTPQALPPDSGDNHLLAVAFGERDSGGYSLGVELAAPTGGHVMVQATRADRRGDRVTTVTRIADRARFRAWLHWLQHVRTPLLFQRMTSDRSERLATMTPPGHGAPGTEGWRWRGIAWDATIQELSGRCHVSLLQAMPPDEALDVRLLVRTCNQLAALALHARLDGVALTDSGGAGAQEHQE